MSKLLGRGNPNRPWSIRAYILKQQPHWHRHSESCEKTPLCTAQIWVNSRKLAKFSFVSLHAVSFSGGCIWFLSEDAEGKRGASAHIQSWWILGPWGPGGDGADFRKYKAVENQNPTPTSHPDTHSHPLFLSYIHTHTHTHTHRVRQLLIKYLISTLFLSPLLLMGWGVGGREVSSEAAHSSLRNDCI